VKCQRLLGLLGLRQLDCCCCLRLPRCVSHHSKAADLALHTLSWPDGFRRQAHLSDMHQFCCAVQAYKSLTDEVSKENYKKYGHPDGPQAMSGA